MLGRRLFAGLLTAAACGATAVKASAAGVVGQTQIDQAIQTINVNAAIRPIDIASAIQPLEVTRTRGNTTTVTLSADVLFAFNQATLTSPAQGTIARVARRLRGQGAGQIRIDGYTDSIGSAGYNLGLSRSRAQAVQTALQQALGTGGGSSFHAIGHGEADPVAPNTKDGRDNPAGRALNRRVVITFHRS